MSRRRRGSFGGRMMSGGGGCSRGKGRRGGVLVDRTEKR